MYVCIYVFIESVAQARLELAVLEQMVLLGLNAWLQYIFKYLNVICTGCVHLDVLSLLLRQCVAPFLFVLPSSPQRLRGSSGWPRP